MERPAISCIQFEIGPSKHLAFSDWQADFSHEITTVKGFVSLEYSLSPQLKKSWSISQRFISLEALEKWEASHQFRELIDALKTLSINEEVKVQKIAVEEEKGSTTELFVTEVSSGKEQEFLAWSAKIHLIEAKFQGFQGFYIQSPSKGGKLWITLLKFDSLENLDRWLKSKERKAVLQESLTFISSMESHRVFSPYAGWFASIANQGAYPPVWKQTMLVLLVLFPIVILEERLLSPFLTGIKPTLGTFIGNLISVTLIAFPLMPLVIWALGFWLPAQDRKTNILGLLFVLLLYLIEIAIFWNFL